jgi:glycosyltransferase involved in cell wall biosynthesis
MRRVLFICYYFPPSGGPGVQRGLKFARYLPEFGWEPMILTVRENAHFPVRDESLLHEIPAGLRLQRTRCPEFYGLYRGLTGQKHSAGLDITSQSETERKPLRRMLRWLRAAVFIPDGRAAWTPFAVRAGLRMIRDEGVDLVFSSGPPFTCHVIGRSLSRKSGLPWVADYRDPWTEATFYPRRPAFARALDARLEASCVREATRNVVVGETMAEEFRRRYPGIPRQRFVVIPNGYDEADFAGVPYQAPPLFRITHTGSIFQTRAPEALLAAIARLARDEEGFADSARLCLAGRLDEALRQRLHTRPLDRVTELPGYLPHGDSVRLLRRSNLLLLLIGADARARGMLTGKLFEYLASGVPILALGPRDGDAARLIERTGAGWTLDPSQTTEIHGLLLSLWREQKAAPPPSPADQHLLPLQFGLKRNEEEIRDYSRRALTHRLADLFDQLQR